MEGSGELRTGPSCHEQGACVIVGASRGESLAAYAGGWGAVVVEWGGAEPGSTCIFLGKAASRGAAPLTHLSLGQDRGGCHPPDPSPCLGPGPLTCSQLPLPLP